MRRGCKKNQPRIKQRLVSQHHNNTNNNVTTFTTKTASVPPISATKLKAKTKKGKKRKLSKGLTQKQKLGIRQFLAEKLGIDPSTVERDVGKKAHNNVPPVLETKNLILKLLGDESAENELQTNYEDDASLLQDLDLVILAASSEDYKRYCQLLRREYEHMSDADYKNMRLKVLQTLLSIPNVYSTPTFQTRYEAAARTNMKDEISTLKA